MFKNIKTDDLSSIEKCVAEFIIWLPKILPYNKMKIRIYIDGKDRIIGFTNTQIKRNYDGSFEGAAGFGKSIDEALEDTLQYFLEMVEEDYPKNKFPNGLSKEDINYSEYSDF